jgi:uncharacterized damage-inducible protein DinB
MEKVKISRRKFMGSTVVGAGCLSVLPASRLFAEESTSLSQTIKNVWKQGREYTLEFANAMPEEKFVFKPTEEVFSFAEQLMHLVGGNYWFFSRLKDEKPLKGEDELKAEGKSKSEVIGFLEESFKYGDDFIDKLTDQIAHEEISAGENKIAKWKTILFCCEHITHHRGQLVVYLRLNGIKPPDYRSGYFA